MIMIIRNYLKNHDGLAKITKAQTLFCKICQINENDPKGDRLNDSLSLFVTNYITPIQESLNLSYLSN